MSPTVRTRMAAGAIMALVMAGCGGPTDDATVVSTAPIGDPPTTEADPTTTETDDPTTTEPASTTTEPASTTTTAPDLTDVCAAITVDQVAAVLGTPAAGTPVQISAAGDGCTWIGSGIALAAAVVSPSILPAETGGAEIFPLFGLVPEDYSTSSVSISSTADTAVVVAVGYGTGTTIDDDAISAISDTLAGQ